MNQSAVLCLVAQSFLSLCEPVGCSLQAPLSTGILQEGILEWAATPSSRGSFQPINWNLGFLHCRWILYHLSHQGSPKILERVAYPFSRGSSWPSNQTGVSCMAGRFFTSWAPREAHESEYPSVKTTFKIRNICCQNQNLDLCLFHRLVW